MLIPIVGGVGLACIKEGKGVDINYTAFMWASIANLAAALKGKLGGSVTKTLKGNKEKNMDSANVYAVMNIISPFHCSHGGHCGGVYSSGGMGQGLRCPWS